MTLLQKPVKSVLFNSWLLACTCRTTVVVATVVGLLVGFWLRGVALWIRGIIVALCAHLVTR